MKLTGQMLREAREKQQLSLSEISMATKINQKVLKSMEQGDLEQLPARTFLRGFVHNYAAYLKLDVDKVMQTFQEEIEPPHAEADPADDLGAQVISGKTLPTSMETSSVFKISAVAGIVLLIGIVFGVKHLIDKYERERELQPLPDVLETVNPAPVLPATQTPAGAAVETGSTPPPPAAHEEKAATETAPATPTPAAAAVANPTTPPTSPQPTGNLPAPPPEKPAVATIKPPEEKPAVIEPPKPAIPAPTPSAGATAETNPPPPLAKPSTSSSNEVILEAFDRIEVVIQVDKESPKKLVLQPDEVHTIKGQGRVVLDLSDGGAVNLIVNGKDRGVPGDLGKPKKVEIP